MRLISISAAFFAVCTSLAAPIEAKSSSLDVTLSQVDNTHIKAIIKNTGDEDMTFMHLDSFGDGSPVKKVSVYRNGTELDFLGIRGHYRRDNITSESVTTLATGATIEDEFDIASTSDLSDGGMVTVRAEGLVSLVTGNKVSGNIPFSSNEISIQVDAKRTSTVQRAVKPLNRRSNIESCPDTQRPVLIKALENAASLANAAAEAALAGTSPQFEPLFKSSSKEVRSAVADRLHVISKEASSTSSGVITYYCNDPYKYCSPALMAYTLPDQSITVNCDVFYEYPALDDTCFDQDQATTVIHEFTHAPAVYSPGTGDFGAGYDEATKLNAGKALKNADTYALFANSVRLGC